MTLARWRTLPGPVAVSDAETFRRGHAPDEAIRAISRRFRLPQSRTRAYLAAYVAFELQRHDRSPWASGDPAPVCAPGDWA